MGNLRSLIIDARKSNDFRTGTKMRKKITTNLPALAVALLLAACVTGCATDAKIRSDYDRDADFSQYQSYNFYAME